MIIVGLGNPGQQYEATRHNIGFLVLQHFVNTHRLPNWKHERGVEFAQHGQHFLIRPQEFMNQSGVSLRNWLTYRHLQIGAEEFVVVHDDLDFPLGEIREQRNRSSGGHNGVQSIIDAFGTQDFRRLRIGIGNNHEHQLPAETYVLQTFSTIEKDLVDQSITKAVDILQTYMTIA